MGIKIIEEKEEYLICRKPPGVDSENQMKKLLEEKVQAEVYCVHRLDLNVSGVMVYAKNKHMAAYLSKCIQEHTFQKEYTLLCEGVFEEKKGDMKDFLYKDARKNKAFPVKKQRQGVKEASLSYEVLNEGTEDKFLSSANEMKPVSLVKVLLHTGRFHQIRCQFASRKHPIVGDGKYGSRIKADGICLKSTKISFPDEKTGEIVSYEEAADF